MKSISNILLPKGGILAEHRISNIGARQGGRMTRFGKRLASAVAISAICVTAGIAVGAPASATSAASPAVVVSKMTGPGSTSNTPAAWGVYSTDLGVMWDNGADTILAAFGDTFGNTWTPPGGNGNDWRSQVLLRSTGAWTDNGDMWVQVDDYSLTRS
jgi:hypothetical protein